MTLREPPKTSGSANIVGRFLGLLMLLAVFAVVVWTAATTQQISAIERTDPGVHAPGEYVEAEEVAIHYLDVGAGPVTLFVHGDNVAGGVILSELATEVAAEGNRVVVPDLFGFGFSARPGQPGGRLAVSGQAETLAAVIEELELGRVELVGFGWGGEVAAELALVRPELVTGLTLVDTTAIPGSGTGIQQLEALPLGLGAAIAYHQEGAAAGAERRFVERCPGWADCTDAEVLEQYRNAATVPGTARAIWSRRASAPAAVAPDRLGEIEIPVTILAVDAAASAAEELAARFDVGEAQVVPPEGLAAAIAAASGDE